MAKKNWRYWFRYFHRDLGYIFFGATLIYAISGLAINHMDDWNPNYSIVSKDVRVTLPQNGKMTKEVALSMLKEVGEEGSYKTFYKPTRSPIAKIFIQGGNLAVDMRSGKAHLEKVSRRKILRAVNFLHYNPGKWWLWFSDIFAVSLIILAVTGIFILKGKNGIKGRGAVLTILGIIIPLLFLLLYYD